MGCALHKADNALKQVLRKIEDGAAPSLEGVLQTVHNQLCQSNATGQAEAFSTFCNQHNTVVPYFGRSAVILLTQCRYHTGERFFGAFIAALHLVNCRPTLLAFISSLPPGKAVVLQPLQLHLHNTEFLQRLCAAAAFAKNFVKPYYASMCLVLIWLQR